MTASREQLLRRVLPPQREAADDPQSFDWSDWGYIIEGMLFAQRPIRAAAQMVTEKHGLAAQGAFMLSLISGGIVYPNDLATALRVSRSLITKELIRLTEAGLVEARQDSADKRRSELRLTAKGRALRDEVRAAMGTMLTRNLRGYSPDQLRLFSDMLRDARQVEELEPI